MYYIRQTLLSFLEESLGTRLAGVGLTPNRRVWEGDYWYDTVHIMQYYISITSKPFSLILMQNPQEEGESDW